MKVPQEKLNLILPICTFFFGILSAYFVIDYINLKNQSTIKVSSNDFNNRKNIDSKPNPFTDIHNNLLKQFDSSFSDSFFSSGLMNKPLLHGFDNSSFTMDDIKIEEHEDAYFKYIDVYGENLDLDAVSINIQDGRILINGEIGENSENNSATGRSFSSFKSTFSKSFNVPSGVDESLVAIEQQKNKVVIKFPKEKL